MQLIIQNLEKSNTYRIPHVIVPNKSIFNFNFKYLVSITMANVNRFSKVT